MLKKAQSVLSTHSSTKTAILVVRERPSIRAATLASSRPRGNQLKLISSATVTVSALS